MWIYYISDNGIQLNFTFYFHVNLFIFDVKIYILTSLVFLPNSKRRISILSFHKKCIRFKITESEKIVSGFSQNNVTVKHCKEVKFDISNREHFFLFYFFNAALHLLLDLLCAPLVPVEILQHSQVMKQPTQILLGKLKVGAGNGDASSYRLLTHQRRKFPLGMVYSLITTCSLQLTILSGSKDGSSASKRELSTPRKL